MHVSTFVRAILPLSLLVALTGCADVITYSRSAEREGLEYYNAGQYTEAAGCFKNAVRQEPRRYPSHYYLGATYFQLGQYQQSIQAYKSALDTMKLTYEGRYDDEGLRPRILDGLAMAIAKSADRNVEIDLIQQRLAGRPNAEDYFLLAKVHRYSGDADSAINAYNHAALIDPKNALVHREYGLYLEQLGQPERAEVPLRRAYQLNPQDPEVNAALARIGVIPGPSLKEKDQLARPVVPEGPIPVIDISKLGIGGREQAATPIPSAEAPRD
jgi:tetratricopeptide (TPR) repeat protein